MDQIKDPVWLERLCSDGPWLLHDIPAWVNRETVMLTLDNGDCQQIYWREPDGFLS